MKKRILITGAAGFIGFHTCLKLLNDEYEVVGLDNLNNYYDIKLKLDRLKELEKFKVNNIFKFEEIDLVNRDKLFNLFKKENFEIVIHLAAQAGVRYSITNPEVYVNSNLVGFNNLLEACRYSNKIKNLIYASSSSVYGGNKKVPFSENDNVDHPVSLYAATKKANELFAHSYSHLFGIPSIGLRFFTVYGPWGRPDMAPFIFTKAIINKKPIQIFNNGNMSRDFTYIDDITEIIIRLINKPPKANPYFNYSDPNPCSSWAPYQLFNVGNNSQISLLNFIETLEEELKIKAIKEFKPMQKGDIQSTFAETCKIENYINYKPRTNLEFGIKNFVRWFKNYYKID